MPLRLENKHSAPCHHPFTPTDTRWNSSEVVPELAMHTRPPTANRHRHLPTADGSTCCTGGSTGQQGVGSCTCASSDDAASSTSSSHHIQVTDFHLRKVLRKQGKVIEHVQLELKWLHSLATEMERLAYQAPHLQTLEITVTDPNDVRWDTQLVLDMASEAAPRFPSLVKLCIHGLPMPELYFNGLQLPRLRYLHISNTGHHLERPPYTRISIANFEQLEALELVDVVVRSPLDLGRITAECPRLRVLHLSEAWSISAQQPRHHRLILPACTVLAVRDSLSCYSLDLYAPRLQHLQLRVLRLSNLQLGPGGSKYRGKHQEDHSGLQLPRAVVTLLRGVLPEAVMEGLSHHTQVGQVEYDDEALAEMTALRDSIQAVMGNTAGSSTTTRTHTGQEGRQSDAGTASNPGGHAQGGAPPAQPPAAPASINAA